MCEVCSKHIFSHAVKSSRKMGTSGSGDKRAVGADLSRPSPIYRPESHVIQADHGHSQMIAVFSWYPSCCCLDCHPEHREGSLSMSREMLRCAQHDNRGALCCPGVSP